MNHITIYGASDDLIEIEGKVRGCDEYPSDEAAFEVAGLGITVTFAQGGTWHISVGPLDEDIPVQAENMVLSVHERGYSMQLDMDIPEGAYITRKAIPDE